MLISNECTKNKFFKEDKGKQATDVVLCVYFVTMGFP